MTWKVETTIDHALSMVETYKKDNHTMVRTNFRKSAIFYYETRPDTDNYNPEIMELEVISLGQMADYKISDVGYEQIDWPDTLDATELANLKELYKSSHIQGMLDDGWDFVSHDWWISGPIDIGVV